MTTWSLLLILSAGCVGLRETTIGYSVHSGLVEEEGWLTNAQLHSILQYSLIHMIYSGDLTDAVASRESLLQYDSVGYDYLDCYTSVEMRSGWTSAMSSVVRDTMTMHPIFELDTLLFSSFRVGSHPVRVNSKPVNIEYLIEVILDSDDDIDLLMYFSPLFKSARNSYFMEIVLLRQYPRIGVLDYSQVVKMSQCCDGCAPIIEFYYPAPVMNPAKFEPHVVWRKASNIEIDCSSP